MPIQLIITNIAFVFSLITCISLGILVFVRRPKKNASLNVTFFLMSICVCIWIVSYALGINLHDPELSRRAFMFNLATIPMAIFSAHNILVVTGRYEKQKKIIKALYGIGFVLIIYFILFPSSLLLPSVDKLYLPNFFVPGPYYSLQDFFFFGMVIYLLTNLMIAYRKADYRKKNQLKFFVVAYVYAYIVGSTPEFLLYDINFDPMPAAFTGLYVIPMAYAILKYEIIDITLIAKRALGYALSIAGVTLLILFTGYANTKVHLVFPDFPEWPLPLISAVIAVIVGYFVWQKVKEVNLLKYQFVDVVTHKFRTPLTYIRWSLDTLRTPDHTAEEKAKALDAINDAHVRLLELTDSLIGLSSSDNSQFMYAYTEENLRAVIDEAAASAKSRLEEKKITLENNMPSDFPKVSIDRKKIYFAFQMIIDNAVTYSPQGGKIVISAEQKGDFVIVSVRDFGIGIAEEDTRRLFSKFYRGSNAIHAHTEGLGIGLYLSRDILRRHGGELRAESEGKGKGSTFVFKIPLMK